MDWSILSVKDVWMDPLSFVLFVVACIDFFVASRAFLIISTSVEVFQSMLLFKFSGFLIGRRRK